jgi:hypothetical protein
MFGNPDHRFSPASQNRKYPVVGENDYNMLEATEE